MRRTVRHWTPAEDALVGALRAANVKAAEIASKIGRSKDQVYWRFRKLVEVGSAAPRTCAERARLGAARSKLVREDRWRREEDQLIREYRERGDTMREIAACLGRSFVATSARIHTLLQSGFLQYHSLDRRKKNTARVRAQRTALDVLEAKRHVRNLANTRDLGYVVGVLYGDGYIHRRAMSIALRCTNGSFVDAFVRAARVSLTPNVKRLMRIEPIKRVGAHTYHKVKYHEAWLHDRHFVRDYERVFGKTTTHDWAIDVADALARGPEYCDGLIQGLFDSDGSVSRQGNSVSIRFGTASRAGARSLAELMSAKGYNIYSAPANSKGEYRVSVRASSLHRYAAEISSRIDYKASRLRAFVRRNALAVDPDPVLCFVRKRQRSFSAGTR
jgi:hypothetical protein